MNKKIKCKIFKEISLGYERKGYGFAYTPRYNFSRSKVQLRNAEITNSNGLNIETYKGPFLSMHHELRKYANDVHTTPCSQNP